MLTKKWLPTKFKLIHIQQYMITMTQRFTFFVR